jgi:hypothetical protein
MPLVGFEPKIIVSERPKTHALDRTATGIGNSYILPILKDTVSLRLIKQHDIKSCGGLEVNNRTFLTSALDGDETSGSRLSSLRTLEQVHRPIQYGTLTAILEDLEINCLPLSGMEPRFVGPPAIAYLNWPDT